MRLFSSSLRKLSYLGPVTTSLSMICIAPRTAIEIIFRNLFSNAAKHHDRESGTISIADYSEGDNLVFTIADDGPGIPSEYEHKIFQLFQTLQTRDKVEGSGIGLSLVEKTMESLAGTVALLPSDGRGTTFRLIWPKSAIERTIAA